MYALDQNPELDNWVHLDTLGYSTQEGIPILGMRISDNADQKEDEPRVLFVGQVHAEEILGLEIVIDMMDDLLFPDASIHTHIHAGERRGSREAAQSGNAAHRRNSGEGA